MVSKSGSHFLFDELAILIRFIVSYDEM